MTGAAFRKLRLSYGISQADYARARGRSDRGYTARLEALPRVDDDHVETLGQMAKRDLMEPSVLAEELSDAVGRSAEADRVIEEEMDREKNGGDVYPVKKAGGGDGHFVAFLRQQVEEKERRIRQLEGELQQARQLQYSTQAATMQNFATMQQQMMELRLRLENQDHQRATEDRIQREVIALIEKEREDSPGLSDWLRVAETAVPLVKELMGMRGVPLADGSSTPPPPPPPQQQHGSSSSSGIVPSRRPPTMHGTACRCSRCEAARNATTTTTTTYPAFERAEVVEL